MKITDIIRGILDLTDIATQATEQPEVAVTSAAVAERVEPTLNEQEQPKEKETKEYEFYFILILLCLFMLVSIREMYDVNKSSIL